ncbi:MAG: YegS/Rv2252/BmrU family lipid kinase [Selenomonadaceae bacterium]|nr:YegS/Rv2252/BmrU family lipid kinase [Selenomonadaceae bacterium]
MKKILMVYNPVSGNAKFKRRLDDIIETFQRRKILLATYRTTPNDTARDFYECVKVFNPCGIISAGGDGTLHAVINWLMKLEFDLPVGIIGSGTSNDFATHLKISDDEEYFDAIADNQTLTVDLGLVNEHEYFINVASAGALTAIAHEVDARQKNSLGKIAYYLHGLSEIPNFKSVQLKIFADGQNFNVDAFLFLVLNSPAVAGLKKVVDAAQIDDGKLDFIAIKKCSPQKIFSLTKKIFSGNCVDDGTNIFNVQAKNFEISSTTNLTSDVDGEIGDALPLKISCIPSAIKIFVKF